MARSCWRMFCGWWSDVCSFDEDCGWTCALAPGSRSSSTCGLFQQSLQATLSEEHKRSLVRSKGGLALSSALNHSYRAGNVTRSCVVFFHYRCKIMRPPLRFPTVTTRQRHQKREITRRPVASQAALVQLRVFCFFPFSTQNESMEQKYKVNHRIKHFSISKQKCKSTRAVCLQWNEIIWIWFSFSSDAYIKNWNLKLKPWSTIYPQFWFDFVFANNKFFMHGAFYFLHWTI